MKTGKFVLFLMLAALAGGSGGWIAAAVAPRGTAQTANATQPGLAVSGIQGSRGNARPSTTEVVATQQPQGQGTSAAGMTAGTVQKVDGGSITLVARDGATTLVKVGNTTTIQKTGQGAIADIVAGESVTVTGASQSDGSIKATNISIGSRFTLQAGTGQSGAGQVGTGQFAGRQGQGTTGTTSARTGGNAGAGSSGSGRSTSGTVQKVDGNTIIVAVRDGSTVQIAVDSQTAIEKTVPGGVGDIVAGDSVVVLGPKSADGSINATSVTIMPGQATSR